MLRSLLGALGERSSFGLVLRLPLGRLTLSQLPLQVGVLGGPAVVLVAASLRRLALGELALQPLALELLPLQLPGVLALVVDRWILPDLAARGLETGSGPRRS